MRCGTDLANIYHFSILDRFSRICQGHVRASPARRVICSTCARAWWMLIGACNPTLCPTHGVQAALRLGRIDTSSTALADAIATAESPAGMLWTGSPGPDPETAVLMRRAMAGWAPAQHSLHHSGVRVAVRTTLFVAQRLREPKVDAMIATDRVLPVLPSELWIMICSFFLRRNFDPSANRETRQRPRSSPRRPHGSRLYLATPNADTATVTARCEV